MKKLSMLLAPMLLLAANVAFAGQLDQNDAFYSFYDTVDGWVNGPLGVGLASTMLLVGGGIGVARNSPMPALTGIAGAAFLHWGPQIIEQIMVGGGLI